MEWDKKEKSVSKKSGSTWGWKEKKEGGLQEQKQKEKGGGEWGGEQGVLIFYSDSLDVKKHKPSQIYLNHPLPKKKQLQKDYWEIKKSCR